MSLTSFQFDFTFLKDISYACKYETNIHYTSKTLFPCTKFILEHLANDNNGNEVENDDTLVVCKT